MVFAKAMGAALFADKISADQASDSGMIYQSVPDDNFAATIDERAGQLANGPTKAYKYIKQAIRASFDNTLADQLSLEAELQGRAGKTRDFTEGVMAFMQKRQPKYEGR